LKQGDVVQFRTEKITSDGSCLARTSGGLVVFVPGALPGEEIRGRIIQKKREYAVAEVEEVLTPHPGRSQSFCPLFSKCGGCQFQHADYSLQCELKRDIVQDAFERIYRAPFPEIRTCERSTREKNYRNKGSLPIREKAGKTTIGYYARRSHDIIPVTSCPILAEGIKDFPGTVSGALSELGLPSYNETNGKGLFRHLILRCSNSTGNTLLSLVASRDLSKKEKNLLEHRLIPLLQSQYPNLGSVTVNYNFSRSNVIVGEKTDIVMGDGLIEEKLAPFRFRYDTTAFFQVNSEQAAKLYETAAQMARFHGESKILELYSGIGTLTCFLAREASLVTAVEEWLPSVRRMKENVEANGLSSKIHILSGSVEKNLHSLNEDFDTVVIDPPRTGCSREAILFFLSKSPHCIVYISCNPATLARDAAILREGGYYPEEIKCFDMFPHTVHVETVVRFSSGQNPSA
jgi:23S rRNA (uracil1939-C5)-methyltransferase